MRLLERHIPKCIGIRKTDIEQDKSGVDYVADIDGGAQVLIDAKTRMKGSRRFWKNGEPELALEVYSVYETRKLGWTLSGSTNVDYILYTFDKSDHDKYYFLPFQLLRKTFWENGKEWARAYGVKWQTSDSWHSSAIFVPVSVVLPAINQTMCGAA